MITYNLKDTSFSHIDYSAPGVESETMIWDRTCSTDSPTFYVHEQILINDKVNEREKYGLLLESQGIIPHIYTALLHKDFGNFKMIFTHSSMLLNKLPNSRWIPGGSVWIGGSYGNGEMKIYPKSKLCSMVSSDKKMCPLHNTRIAMAELLQDCCPQVDHYGTLFGEWTPIIDSLKDYRFSIICENYIDDAYFTEKILNCFATGTIPIYMGARNIGKYFNSDGILLLDKPGDLLYILAESVNDKFYESKQDAILDNFEECKRYRLLEDYMYRKYLV